MPVLLHTVADLPRTFDRWAALDEASARSLEPRLRVPGLGGRLEDAYDKVIMAWLELGRDMGGEKSATLAHAPSCNASVSDMGLMLAWSRLVEDWAKDPKVTTLVVCDDPWMFRHFKELAGVACGPAPALAGPSLALWVRGYAARTRVALRLLRAALTLRFQRRQVTPGRPTLLVYGHPRSTAEGIDGYFGYLMQRLPQVTRILHVDCSVQRAMDLARDGRSLSLHGFGCPGGALLAPFAKWRPSAKFKRGPQGWLVRRAAAKEGGSGQAAMLAWQGHCQRKWLKRARPSVVAWPWENHSWERAFIRCARSLGVRTLGYQHTVVGRQMFFHGPGSNVEGMEGLPDRIFTSSQSTLDRLKTMGVDPDRMGLGGALRFSGQRPVVAYDPQAPIFVALPFDTAVCEQMLEACKKVEKRRFLIKDHPMSPFDFVETENVRRTDAPLGAQSALSAVLFAATTVGLEAILAGLPTLRFQPTDRISMDILPEGVQAVTVGAETLPDAMDHLSPPKALSPAYFFGPVDWAVWEKELGAQAQHG